jgi:DNA relaxase NicK
MLSQISVEHPLSLTGAKCQNSLSVLVDYLRVILPISRSDYTLEAIDLLLKDYLSVALDFSEDIPYSCGRKFAKGHRNHDNTCILGYNFSSDDTGEAILNISGASLARLSIDRLHSFMRTFYDLGAHCTRIDIAVDDFTKSYFNYEKLQSALQSGNFSGARLSNYSCKYDGNNGWLVTVGKRSNSVYRRFYNKSVESKGQIDSYRFETEYKNDHSKTIFNTICTLDLDAVLDFTSQLIGGSVDFIDRSQADRASRSPRLPWWENFIQILGGSLRWSVPRVARTIEKSIKWVQKQVASTLAVISECKGFDWFEKWLQESIEAGHRRFKPLHFNRIENYFLEDRLIT